MKPTFKNMSFSELVKQSEELRDTRKEYAQKTAEERRMAASFHYDSIIASELFNDAVNRAGIDGLDSYDAEPDWPGEVTALAIDPDFGPALLSVGSGAYLIGRTDECMEHFYHLASLPEEEEELDKMIEKAADFLRDRGDLDKSIDLVLFASKKHLEKAIYHDLLSYYYGKSKEHNLAVEHGQLAVKMEPNNHEFLSNLGWSLIEAGDYDEAEKVLNKAVKLAPDYEYATGNLEELNRRRRSKKGNIR